ncbi:putative membrane protein YphA (DoxX/SURF4 family) [Mesoflavibacter sabulilitoris]|uniref:DoxX family membrane protein n=1 Tax=Mesoflavibacter zeaxanthinifaciens subsp. sabulilitoris TaxID=1520893 RepID=A0A2T1N6I8_9FLAO|nr:DoxX family membrane protein [Mesoflavibacter zeaxanthinifaciens]MBB3123150.1 putative membrane protein YphA (DoxX/SURF4 family) [Mesoflavibacter zeaxanthinifaciens subsp. sabulilitoris]PSG87209.1 DoxX family membrane protein [Mesoflavibacter zeaxanthinifaciens subsp. sabulilitoris]
MISILDHITEIILLLFLAITFLQSGLDKILDWKGNIGWLKEHFSKTFMGKIVEINVAIILIIEVIAGILAVLGIYQLIVNDNSTLGFYAAILSAITLLLLLFGQRVAKDYDGARTIVIYLIPTLFALYLMQ